MRSLAVSIPFVLASMVVFSQGPQDSPTFRAEVQAIEVDVLVTDRNENVVRGLTRENFTLLEDGIPQPISAVAFVDFPRPSKAEGGQTAELEVATNIGVGRLWVMMLNLGGERTRLLARQFIQDVVRPHDQVAIFSVLGSPKNAQGFTKNRNLMLTAVDRIVWARGDDVGGLPAGGRFGPRAPVASFRVAEEVFQQLGRITGRRKTVIWVSPPPTFISPDPEEMIAQRDALRAATRNNVALYVVSTTGLGTGLGRTGLEQKAGIQLLGEETGGGAIVGTNNYSGGFQRFAKDTSSYYLLTYTPQVAHRDGKFHKIDVRVNRPGVTVRMRRGYLAPEPGGAPAVLAAEKTGLSGATAEALGMPMAAGELGIDLVAAPFRGQGNSGSVLLTAQLRGTDLALGRGAPIEIAYQGVTPEGTVTPGAFHTFALDFGAGSQAAIERSGVRMVGRIELPPGRHQVRFAVHQPGGKTGSVLADVEVPNYTTPLAISGLLVASQATASHRTLLMDPALRTILGSDPTPIRRFDRADVLAIYAETYSDPNKNESVRMTAGLMTAQGKRLRSFETAALPREPGRTGHLTRFPLTDLAPGDYVFTLDTSLARAKATRQVAFAVVAGQSLR